MKSWIPSSVLAISPHADDIELGAGGTIHRWTSNGARVFLFIFSTLKNKVHRMPEIIEAAKCIGIDREDLTVLDYPNRRFPEFRQDILQNMIDLSPLEPDVVLVPTTTDHHQDHEVIVAEAVRAYKNTTILGYEALWNMTQANLPVTIKLDKIDLEAKHDAVAAHVSEEHRPYTNPSFIESLARVRGLAAGFEYGESFEVLRWVM